MIGTKRKVKMKRIFSVLLLVILVNCSTTVEKAKEENKPSIDNIVDVLKSVPWPKF